MTTIQEKPEVEERRRRRMERMRARRKSVSGTYPKSYIECLERKNRELTQEIETLSTYLLPEPIYIFRHFQALSAKLLLHQQEDPQIPEIELRRIQGEDRNLNHSDYKSPISLHPKALDYEDDRDIPLYIGRTSVCKQHAEYMSRRSGTTGDGAAWYLDQLKRTSPSSIGDHRRPVLFGLGPNGYQQLGYYTKSLCVSNPFSSTGESVITLFDPVLESNSHRERGSKGFNCFRKPSFLIGSSLLAYGVPLAAAAFNHWDALRVTSGVASMGTGVAVIPLQQVEGVPEKAWLWTSMAWAGCFMPYLWLKTREIPSQFLYRRKFYIFSVILASVHFIIGMSQGLEGAGSGFALYGPIVLTTCAYLVSFVFVPHGASDRDIVATGLEYLGVSPGAGRALNPASTPNSAPAER